MAYLLSPCMRLQRSSHPLNVPYNEGRHPLGPRESLPTARLFRLGRDWRERTWGWGAGGKYPEIDHLILCAHLHHPLGVLRGPTGRSRKWCTVGKESSTDDRRSSSDKLSEQKARALPIPLPEGKMSGCAVAVEQIQSFQSGEGEKQGSC